MSTPQYTEDYMFPKSKASFKMICFIAILTACKATLSDFRLRTSPFELVELLLSKDLRHDLMALSFF